MKAKPNVERISTAFGPENSGKDFSLAFSRTGKSLEIVGPG